MKEKLKKINYKNMFIVLLIVLLVSVTLLSLDKEKNSIKEQEPEKVVVGYDKGEMLENFSKNDAVEAFKNILQSVENDPQESKRELKDRIAALDKEETDLKDVISEETMDKIYLQEEFESDKFNRRFVASALLTYYDVISRFNETGKIESVMDEESIDSLVYLDKKLMKAHIPMDLFTGESKGIAFEMQYIDGEWYYNPYTSMMSLIMLVNYENQIKK